MQFEVGTVLEGKVCGIAAFGAFVELPDGKSGLVHISEVSSRYVNDINEHLKEGQTVVVKVISTEKGKISLSIKQVEKEQKEDKPVHRKEKRKSAERRAAQPDFSKPPEEVVFGRRDADMSFDDMLQKFKQDSDEKFQDLKRSNDNKRSGGYKRSY